MIIELKKDLVRKIGEKNLEPFGINSNSWNYRDRASIDLATMRPEKILALSKLFRIANEAGHRGARYLWKDTERWVKILGDSKKVRARSVVQFHSLLVQHVGDCPHRHIFMKWGTDKWLAHYVEKIEYIQEYKTRNETVPEHVRMTIHFEQFGGKFDKSILFWPQECRGQTVTEALGAKDFVIENKELRDEYLATMKLYGETTKVIGRQYYAVGTATDDMDGNPKDRDSSWYWSRTNTVQMERAGGQSKVVIDVFYENDKTRRDDDRNDHPFDPFFWRKYLAKPAEAVKETEEDEGEEVPNTDDLKIADEIELAPEFEVPVHPFCAVFDLARHIRLRIHVGFLTPYVYDKKIADKLVISDELKGLVHMLIEHRAGTFQDIIKGKSGGAVVMLAGKPGVGKTLTAEVYAESEGKALYTVQCSQLGTAPTELEDNLLKVFARAKRWGAVTLLDEADVYVRSRGSDLQQNAIVGVFLRVLEYQDSVLFLTTNRPDDVDDAIASRCIARLNYKLPTPAEQGKIWLVLMAGAKVQVSSTELKKIVANSKDISGRDVKNLLKLALLICKDKEITAEVIEHVKQFRPAI